VIEELLVLLVKQKRNNPNNTRRTCHVLQEHQVTPTEQAT